MSNFGFIGLLGSIEIVIAVVIIVISRDQSELKNRVEYLQDQIDDLRNQLLG